MRIYCERLKRKVEEKSCNGCIFLIEKRDTDDQLYLICNYDNWYPGLLKNEH